MRLLSFSSGLAACGIADYNRHLTHALRELLDCDTVLFPTKRAGRHQFRRLLALRAEYVQLAARADAYDAAIVQWQVRFWNGTRPVENMFPRFLKRIRKPPIVVLHEWPHIPKLHDHEGRLPMQLAKRALTAAWMAHDVGQLDYRRWVERDMFGSIAHIIVHAPELRARIVAAGVAPDKITVERFPVHELPPPSWTVDEVSERFGLRGRRVLLLLGHPVPRKGFDLAVQALPRLPEDVVLVLVCSQADEAARASVDGLGQLARELGVERRVIVTGFLDDAQLASMLCVAKLGVSPFRSVTGSSSIAHFLAAGLPVIASDLPAIRQVTEAGAGIRLFEPGGVDDLVDKINETLHCPEAMEHLRAANDKYRQETSFRVFARRVKSLLV